MPPHKTLNLKPASYSTLIEIKLNLTDNRCPSNPHRPATAQFKCPILSLQSQKDRRHPSRRCTHLLSVLVFGTTAIWEHPWLKPPRKQRGQPQIPDFDFPAVPIDVDLVATQISMDYRHLPAVQMLQAQENLTGPLPHSLKVQVFMALPVVPEVP